jgi:bacterioferritin (cytochrome b1)
MVNNFLFQQKLQQILPTIINNPHLHGRWLNTLSFLENCGARKLAACEHPTKVKEEMLKHASEEFRHAYHLKRQISKVTSLSLDNYFPDQILGNTASLHYLHALDMKTCRYLKEKFLVTGQPHYPNLSITAYLFVTYAIEVRAGKLYPVYHESLRTYGSKVSVKSILLEEEEHLAEIFTEMQNIDDYSQHSQAICLIEENLCQQWIEAIEDDLKRTKSCGFLLPVQPVPSENK